MRKKLLNTIVTISLLTMGNHVFAQCNDNPEEKKRWEDRVFVNLSAGYQTASQGFEYRDTQVIFFEEASAQVTADGKNDFAFDIGGGVRLVQNLGVGISYSRYRTDQTGDLAVSIPHPWFYNEHAFDNLDVPLKRTEKALHIDAVYMFPLTERLQLAVFGGPTRFQYEQEVVEDFGLSSSIETDMSFNIELEEPLLRTLEGSVWGYNVGADVIYLFSRNVGVGGLVRYSRASTDVENAFMTTRTEMSNTASKLELGGLQVFAGLRMRF
jgi:hypothetical protein